MYKILTRDSILDWLNCEIDTHIRWYRYPKEFGGYTARAERIAIPFCSAREIYVCYFEEVNNSKSHINLSQSLKKFMSKDNDLKTLVRKLPGTKNGKMLIGYYDSAEWLYEKFQSIIYKTLGYSYKRVILKKDEFGGFLGVNMSFDYQTKSKGSYLYFGFLDTDRVLIDFVETIGYQTGWYVTGKQVDQLTTGEMRVYMELHPKAELKTKAIEVLRTKKEPGS